MPKQKPKDTHNMTRQEKADAIRATRGGFAELPDCICASFFETLSDAEKSACIPATKDRKGGE